MLQKMASKSILLLGIFLLGATKVFTYDEKNLKTVVNYADQPPPTLVVTAPTPPSPVKAPPIVEAPTQTPLGQPPVSAPAPLPAPIVKSWRDCIPLCFYRCKLHLRKILCMTQCMTCCDRCKCVPPGTYGNRQKCGKCYTDMRTLRNKFMCP